MIWFAIPPIGSTFLHPGSHYSFGLLYADPGSGALAWQLLLSLLFGAMFYVRTVTRKVRTFITNRKGRQLVGQVTAPGLEDSSADLANTVPKSEDY